jgi:hypothetical protein
LEHTIHSSDHQRLEVHEYCGCALGGRFCRIVEKEFLPVTSSDAYASVSISVDNSGYNDKVLLEQT